MINKKGAMEMSMGTIVTIVLLMSVLVLGIFLVQKIFTSGTNAIDGIDSALENEIKDLFSEGTEMNMLVFPKERYVELEQGSQGKGIALSIQNREISGSRKFYYQIKAVEIGATCRNAHALTTQVANTFLESGSEGSYTIQAGFYQSYPAHITFTIPETAPLCLIVYRIEISKQSIGGPIFDQVDYKVQIV